jgi:hypothetical protein
VGGRQFWEGSHESSDSGNSKNRILGNDDSTSAQKIGNLSGHDSTCL